MNTTFTLRGVRGGPCLLYWYMLTLGACEHSSNAVETPAHPSTPQPLASAAKPPAPSSVAASGTASAGTLGDQNPRETSPKLALLVGINDYADSGISDLKGTLNDVAAMRDVLMRRFGLRAGDILQLTDASATRDNILEGFRRHLIDRADKDTVVLFYYSGHGSTITDFSRDEPDKTDETIVTQDSGRVDGPNRDITDDELNTLLEALAKKTPHVTVILDSCHSGTGVRGPRARFVPGDTRAPAGGAPATSTAKIVDGSSGFRSNNLSYTLISGARSDEYSYERSMEGRQMGALTWSLTRALWRARADTTYREIMDGVSADVTAAFASQHPQIEGLGRDSIVFSRERIEPAIYVEVRSKAGKLELQAGEVHGVEVGAVFAAHPVAAAKFDTKPLAKLEITAVSATTAQAKVIDGAGMVPDGARAVELRRAFSKTALRVGFTPDRGAEIERLRELLKQYPHIVTTPKADDADVVVELTPNKGFVLKGSTRQPISRTVAPGANAATTALDDLRKWAKWYSVLRIENERSPNGVKPVNADLSIVGSSTVFAGDEVKFRLRNNSPKRLYFSLLDLSAEASVSLMHPAPGAQEFVEPGAMWEKSITACVPKGAKEPLSDIVKVIFTEQPADLSSLEQLSIGHTRGGEHSLLGLFSTVAFGAGSRGFERPEAPPSAGWATKQVGVTIKPKAGAKPCGA